MDDEDLLGRADELLEDAWGDMAQDMNPPSQLTASDLDPLRHTVSGVSNLGVSSVHSPSASAAMGWPSLPRQWTTDVVGAPSGYKTLYAPDPSKTNEELQAGLRGYFSTPLADPNHDFSRTRVPPHATNRALLLAPGPPKLVPDDRLAQTSTHLLRKTHSGAVKEWLSHQKVLLANAYPTEILPRLHKTFKNAYRERTLQALDLEREARLRRTELREMQQAVRGKVAGVRERRAAAAAQQMHHAEIEAYCAALRGQAAQRWAEADLLHSELEQLQAEKRELQAGLQLPDALAAAGALAGIRARAAMLQAEADQVEQW